MEIDKPAVAFILTVTVSQIVLLVLKLANVINWGWIWIFAPLWIPYALFIVCGIILCIYIVMTDLIERIRNKHV